jgi:putative flippase GtrA
MGLTPSSMIAYAGAEETRKKLRYAAVSAIFVPIGQGLIQVFGLWLGAYTAAAFISAAIVAFPLFFANKHFVWRVTSGENLRSQVFVFWITAMLGVLVAALFTFVVEHMMADHTSLVRGTAVFFAQMLGLAIVWIGRYLVLDRWLFKLVDDIPDLTGPPTGESQPDPSFQDEPSRT